VRHGDQQIISNLRFKYGDKISHISDEELIERYNMWNLSDKLGNELDWLLLEP